MDEKVERGPAAISAADRTIAAIEKMRSQTSRDERYDLGWDDALLAVLARLRSEATGGPEPSAKPKRKRVDWSNVVVDEGDEALW